jgi:hypothetical protein
VISSSQGLCLNIRQHKHRTNTYTHQTSMSCVGFEPTIPASERAKTVHAIDSAALKYLLLNVYRISISGTRRPNLLSGQIVRGRLPTATTASCSPNQ